MSDELISSSQASRLLGIKKTQFRNLWRDDRSKPLLKPVRRGGTGPGNQAVFKKAHVLEIKQYLEMNKKCLNR